MQPNTAKLKIEFVSEPQPTDEYINTIQDYIDEFEDERYGDIEEAQEHLKKAMEYIAKEEGRSITDIFHVDYEDDEELNLYLADMVEDVSGRFEFGTLSYDPVRTLRAVDPIAYRTYCLEELDYMVSEGTGQAVEIEGDYYFVETLLNKLETKMRLRAWQLEARGAKQ